MIRTPELIEEPKEMATTKKSPGKKKTKTAKRSPKAKKTATKTKRSTKAKGTKTTPTESSTFYRGLVGNRA